MKDSIPYATVGMGIMRANYAIFPISVRNSPAAIAHLISAVGVKHILVGAQPAIQDLTKSALEVLATEYPLAGVPELSPMLTFKELYSGSVEHVLTKEDVPFEFKGPDAVVMYLHSSGA